MKVSLYLGLLCAGLTMAQTPDFSGVWKSNADKSKGLPAGGSLLVSIETKDGRMSQTSALTTPQRETRSALRWDLSGKEGRGTLGGLPLKSTAKWDGGTLIVNITQPNKQSAVYKYTLSADGNTLTLDQTETTARGDRQTVAVLEKQPADAAAALKAPEVTAAASGHYKNLKLLGNVPASSVGDTMRSWAFALGKDCNFCHVQGNFADDAKPEKATARKMVEMAMAINKNHFDGKNEVRCYTCHQGNAHPPGPQF